MESEPMRIVREGIELFNRREYERGIAGLPQEIVWDTSTAVPDGAVHSGRERVLAYWRDVDSRWDDFRIEPERWVETDGAVLMLGRLIARGAGSGVPVDTQWDQVWRVEGGVPVRCENYTDRARAWRAAGLEPEPPG